MSEDFSRAEALFRRQDYLACITLCRQLLIDAPYHPPLSHLLGVALIRGGRPVDGLVALEHQLKRQPDNLLLRMDYALGLADRGDIDRAVVTLAEGAVYHPGNPDLAARLARLLTDHGRHADAQRVLRASIPLHPGNLELRGLLVAELAADLQFAASIDHLRHLIAQAPDHALIQGNIGVLLQSMGAPLDALRHYRRAVQLDPDNHVAQVNLGTALLTEGDYSAGFAHFEHRQWLPDMRRVADGLVRWRGEKLDGKSLLVTSEQGFGDLIQFIRFLPLLIRQGGRIWLECPAELTRLFGALPGLAGVLGPHDPVPKVDWAIPMLSLPFMLETGGDLRSETIPYLPVPGRGPSLPPDERPRIGLVWSGSMGRGELFVRRSLRRRSCRLEELDALWGCQNYRWFSLQLGAAGDELKGADQALTNLAPLIGDFADSACLLGQLDLLITIDTAMAHLAGALGRPVWVMLAPGQADYRWQGTRGATTPWYPTARLFRCGSAGWPALATEIRSALGAKFSR